ncbi:unnamed protein product [Arctogadus glacialis]
MPVCPSIHLSAGSRSLPGTYSGQMRREKVALYYITPKRSTGHQSERLEENANLSFFFSFSPVKMESPNGVMFTLSSPAGQLGPTVPTGDQPGGNVPVRLGHGEDLWECLDSVSFKLAPKQQSISAAAAIHQDPVRQGPPSPAA